MTDVVKKESTCQKIGEATTDEGDDAEVKLSHINVVTFIDSDTKLRFKLCPCLRGKRKHLYTEGHIEGRIIKLHNFCLTHLIDSYRLHINREKGMMLLNKIIMYTSLEDLNQSQVVSLVWCAISFVHHFYARLGAGTNAKQLQSRKKETEKALRSYERLLEFLLPENSQTVTNAIFTFFCEANIWDWEILSIDMLRIITNILHEEAFHHLLTLIEKKTIKDSRRIIRVLSRLLERYKWNVISENLLNRFLLLYKTSIETNEEVDTNLKAFEACLRFIVDNLECKDLMKVITTMLEWTFQDISDTALLDFGNLLEYAAILHNTQGYITSIPEHVFPLVLNLIASDNILHSLLGNRVLQHLLDRNCNRLQLETPRIFYQGTHFNINVQKFVPSDLIFLKKYREKLHETLLASFKKHGSYRINLENSFTSIAVILVEVPSGFTAAMMVCLAMTIQENTIEDSKIELENSHRLHATVISIMSLICWLHNATVFYEYVNTILERRAEFAPHLNPPLMFMYQYAQHHILWNKPDLFFEDWEVRYGLWRCFKAKRVKDSSDKDKVRHSRFYSSMST